MRTAAARAILTTIEGAGRAAPTPSAQLRRKLIRTRAAVDRMAQSAPTEHVKLWRTRLIVADTWLRLIAWGDEIPASEILGRLDEWLREADGAPVARELQFFSSIC